MKKTSYFWIGFSDLMTSLFFIMLILFAVTFTLRMKDKKAIEDGINAQSIIKELKEQINHLQKTNKELTIEKAKFEEIENVEKALSELDPDYYTFDPNNKRYKLAIDVLFPANESDINKLDPQTRSELVKAGQELFSKISTLVNANKNIDYLLVIEGNTERFKNNWIDYADRGYKLSYDRALALFNFWKANGIDLNILKGQCEVIIAGSGYFGQSRNTVDEGYNRRFSIQVTSKIGKFLQKKDK